MWRFGILASFALLIASASGVFAQKITLESFDGTLRLSGELESFDGTLYVLRSPIGPIEIEADLVSCVSEVCPSVEIRGSDEPLGVSGSQTMTDIMLPLVLETYGFGRELEMVLSSNTESGLPNYLLQTLEGEDVLTVESEPTGTEGGFLSLLEGQSLITLAARSVRIDENEWFAEVSGDGLRTPQNERVIGLDGIAVIVSRDNPVEVLAERQAADLFSGNISNWSEVGGPDMPVKVYRRENVSAAAEVFYSLALSPFGRNVTAEGEVIASDSELSDLVSRDPLAIGYTGFASIRNAKPLAIEGT